MPDSSTSKATRIVQPSHLQVTASHTDGNVSALAHPVTYTLTGRSLPDSTRSEVQRNRMLSSLRQGWAGAGRKQLMIHRVLTRRQAAIDKTRAGRMMFNEAGAGHTRVP